MLKRHPYFMDKQRQTILKILNKFFDLPYEVDKIINKEIREFDLQQQGFIKAVVNGVLRRSYTLDYVIRSLSRTRFSRINKEIINILRMSLYQLIYMSHIPSYAVIYEGVELAKNISKRQSSFVNGVLRSFERDREDILNFKNIHYKDRLVIEYSYPMWLVELFISEYGEEAEIVMEKYNEEPSFEIRNNSLLGTRKELLLDLESHGYDSSLSTYTKDGIIIEDPKDIFDTQLYDDGRFYVQSISSQKSIEILDVEPGYILDLCAAPGGKITHAYQITEGNGEYLALDLSSERIELIKENIVRLKMDGIDIGIEDGTILNQDYIEKFDHVIADVPCSGLGLIRKYPEMKHTKTLEGIKDLIDTQYRILENGSRYLKPGGTMVYSTCSFTTMENKDVIDRFLKNHSNFSLISLDKLSPHINNSDGFTVGVIKKNEDIKQFD